MAPMKYQRNPARYSRAKSPTPRQIAATWLLKILRSIHLPSADEFSKTAKTRVSESKREKALYYADKLIDPLKRKLEYLVGQFYHHHPERM